LEVESGGGQQAPTNIFARFVSVDSEQIDCIKPFTAKLAAWSKLPAYALEDEERLNHISDLLLASFHMPVTANVRESSMEVVAKAQNQNI
jgi:hypothetical protein